MMASYDVLRLEQIERELELQQTKEMLARLGKKVDNVEKMDKSGREVQSRHPLTRTPAPIRHTNKSARERVARA